MTICQKVSSFPFKISFTEVSFIENHYVLALLPRGNLYEPIHHAKDQLLTSRLHLGDRLEKLMIM